MRIAVLGDVHLIAEADPNSHYRVQRDKFFRGVPAFRRAIRWMNTLDLDAVFSVGDLVDWGSDANVALAVELMSELNCPWHLTPGNHDFQMPGMFDGETYDNDSAEAQRASCSDRWRGHGVMLGDRRIDLDGWSVLLVDSATSQTSQASTRWLQGQQTERSVLITHVPIDRPEVRAYIHGRDPDRDFSVYVQSGSPHLFDEAIAGHIHHVITGHLHFPGTVRDGGTTFHLLDGSFARDGREPEIALVESAGDALQVSRRTAGT